MTFTFATADLEKVRRLAAFGFLEGVWHWATCFGADLQAVQQPL